MSYTVFNQNNFNFMDQPMFFGESVSVARFDQQVHPKFEKLTEKQLAFFWRPEEINLTKDANDYKNLPDHEKHIFISNLKYQTLLDSIQGRSPTSILVPIISDPALENWVETWGFSETIHSRSYTHILRNIVPNPSEILDDIMVNPHIRERAVSVAIYYDECYQLVLKYLQDKKQFHNNEEEMKKLYKKLYLCLHAINALEAIRFYVSFACSFAFGDRGVMSGNSSIIQLIARDESLHLSGTQYILKEIQNGSEGKLFAEVAHECKKEAEQLFLDCVHQEKEWAAYLFKDGSMIGLNEIILNRYLEHIADQRMRAVGLTSPFIITKNPIPWINTWLVSDNVQTTPQEKENSSYLTGQLDTNLSVNKLSNFEL